MKQPFSVLISKELLDEFKQAVKENNMFINGALESAMKLWIEQQKEDVNLDPEQN